MGGNIRPDYMEKICKWGCCFGSVLNRYFRKQIYETEWGRIK